MSPESAEEMAVSMINATTSAEALAGEELRGRIRVLKFRMSDEAAARISVRMLQRKHELADATQNSALRAVLESLDLPAFEFRT